MFIYGRTVLEAEVTTRGVSEDGAGIDKVTSRFNHCLVGSPGCLEQLAPYTDVVCHHNMARWHPVIASIIWFEVRKFSIARAERRLSPGLSGVSQIMKEVTFLRILAFISSRKWGRVSMCARIAGQRLRHRFRQSSIELSVNHVDDLAF
jgi:hypothetical protein